MKPKLGEPIHQPAPPSPSSADRCGTWRQTSPIRPPPRRLWLLRGKRSVTSTYLIVNHARSGHGRLAERRQPSSWTPSCMRTSGRRSCSSKSSLPNTTADPADASSFMTSGQHLAPMGRGSRLRSLQGRPPPGNQDARRRTDRPRHHRQHRSTQARPTPAGTSPTKTRNPPHAPRPLGPTRRRRATHRLALQRRRWLDHRPSRSTPKAASAANHATPSCAASLVSHSGTLAQRSVLLPLRVVSRIGYGQGSLRARLLAPAGGHSRD